MDLQPTDSVYILPLQLAASRPDLEQLIRRDSHIRSACAEAAQLSAGATDILPAIMSMLLFQVDLCNAIFLRERYHLTCTCRG